MITTSQRCLQEFPFRSRADILRLVNSPHPMAREELHLLTFSDDRHLIDRHLIAIGALPAGALADILRYTLYDKAEAIILIRTVPEDSSTPTNDEQSFINDLEDLCGVLDIDLHDYLRTGSSNSYRWTEDEEDMPF